MSRPLYHNIVHLARDAGLTGATAKGMPYGFTQQGGPVRDGFPAEPGAIDVRIFVEIFGPRAKLESFLLGIAPLIENRVVIYKEIEHWTVTRPGSALEKPTDSAEGTVRGSE